VERRGIGKVSPNITCLAKMSRDNFK
jgi:hypothetical protein